MEKEIKWLTISEAAKKGPLKENALRKMRDVGTLPCIKMGKKTLVNYPALLSMLTEKSMTYNTDIYRNSDD